LKDMYRELIADIQNVRLLDRPLPMDRYAQTTIRNGRPEITINSLIGRMPGVNAPERVRPVAAWHESIHADRNIGRHRSVSPPSLPLGLEVSTSSPILCRGEAGRLGEVDLREFVSETCGLAAAIADADLRRCQNYLNFLQLAAEGRGMGLLGWQLLDSVSATIGVDVTSLCWYFEQHGICRLSYRSGKPQLIGAPAPFRWFVCLEPLSASLRSVA